jgi:hypothetical protein
VIRVTERQRLLLSDDGLWRAVGEIFGTSTLHRD